MGHLQRVASLGPGDQGVTSEDRTGLSYYCRPSISGLYGAPSPEVVQSLTHRFNMVGERKETLCCGVEIIYEYY